MSVPSFLSGAFRYKSTLGVVDVATIISDLMSELVTNGTWTDLGGTGVGPFKSPVDPVDGSFMKLTLTRVDATHLQYALVDQYNAAFAYTGYLNINIDVAGNEVRYHTGPDFIAIELARATPDGWWCARLNVWPETAGQGAAHDCLRSWSSHPDGHAVV